MIVLGNRKCGTPQPGGLYAIGRRSAFGTLLPFTAIAAPLPAEIANPRRPQVVDTARTLAGVAGLVNYDPSEVMGRFARLPVQGLADFWGQSQGYRNVWDVVEETRVKGICRRVSQVLDVPLPCPVLMMHAEAVVDVGWSDMVEWMEEQGIGWQPEHYAEGGPVGYPLPMVTVHDQPWREAYSLGRRGDNTFLWHPYAAFWEMLPEFRRRRLFSRFVRECGVRFGEGIFGISWITDFAYCLRSEEDEVPEHLAAKGVIGAVNQDDSRGR